MVNQNNLSRIITYHPNQILGFSGFEFEVVATFICYSFSSLTIDVPNDSDSNICN